MARAFRRSRLFGLIGVFVVAGVAIAIALTASSTDPNPKLQLGLIFGVIAVFVFTLLLLQRRDLDAGAAVDARHGAGGPREIEDPTTLAEGELWAALAVKPIDSQALKARSWMWETGRRSIRLAFVICILIFLTVPAIYLFESFLPLIIGGPLIALVAVYGGIRAIGSGGEVDQAYENADQAMQPLGLGVTERPEVRFETRAPTMPGYSARLHGPLVLMGERHGRTVRVDQEGGVSEVTVSAAVPSFEAKARDGRIRSLDGAPEEVGAALGGVANSTRWKGVSVSGGRDGVTVRRKSGLAHWLCDLWLAELLAEKL
jgi:hypothetical protein